jgi:hypothetical protein
MDRELEAITSSIFSFYPRGSLCIRKHFHMKPPMNEYW